MNTAILNLDRTQLLEEKAIKTDSLSISKLEIDEFESIEFFKLTNPLKNSTDSLIDNKAESRQEEVLGFNDFETYKAGVAVENFVEKSDFGLDSNFFGINDIIVNPSISTNSSSYEPIEALNIIPPPPDQPPTPVDLLVNASIRPGIPLLGIQPVVTFEHTIDANLGFNGGLYDLNVTFRNVDDPTTIAANDLVTPTIKATRLNPFFGFDNPSLGITNTTEAQGDFNQIVAFGSGTAATSFGSVNIIIPEFGFDLVNRTIIRP